MRCAAPLFAVVVLLVGTAFHAAAAAAVSSSTFSPDYKTALAGGLAGATGTFLLFPIDTAKVSHV